MKDHALNKYPEHPNNVSFNTFLLFGLVGEDERPLFTKYAEPDEPCFSSVLRARGFAIWHNPTKTRVLAREWLLYRVSLKFREDDLHAVQHIKSIPRLELSGLPVIHYYAKSIQHSYNQRPKNQTP